MTTSASLSTNTPQAPPWQRRRLLSVCLTAAVLNSLLGGPFTQIGIAQLKLPATVVAG